MRTITLEDITRPEHSWMVQDANSRTRHKRGAHPLIAARIAKLVDELCDLNDHRIEDMDAAGIDVQVLSLTSPGVDQLEAA